MTIIFLLTYFSLLLSGFPNFLWIEVLTDTIPAFHTHPAIDLRRL
jgi:hypothetical protein